MGTSGSYSGGGGKPGSDLREGISDWLNSLPSIQPAPNSEPITSSPGEAAPAPSSPPELQPETVLPVVGLFRRRSRGRSDGPSGRTGGVATPHGATARGRGGGGRGGAQRSAGRSASTAGRAGAAAYAYRTGDADTLRELGLDYDALRASGDSIEITQRIVEAACESFSDGTIEDDERRHVAAAVALWVLEENEAGAPPEPDEIARHTLAEILFEAMATESAALLRDGKRALWATREGERQMREAAEALAERANLSTSGATPSEFVRAIEQGIDTLHSIWGGPDA
jgi:hypothetical protein